MESGVAKQPLIDRLMLRVAGGHAARVYRRFIAATEKATSIQTATLLSKVRRHATSAYGRDHHFASIRSYDDFRRNVPIQRYEDLAPYIERVKQGELSALFGPRETLHMFALTSGTTDKPKFIPVTGTFLRQYREGWNAFGVKALMDHAGTFLRPIVQVSSPMDEFRTPAGIPCGAITGLMAATQKRLVRKYYVAPLCVSTIDDSTARYYTIMRLAVPRDVAFMVTANPATQLKLVRTADAHRAELIRDIHDGTLSEEFPVAATVRRELAPRLRPQPDVARRLDGLVEEHGALRPRDYWRLGFLANWLGGTMGLYRPQLEAWFGRTPVRDIGLLASEGRMSVPIDDETPAGILEVTSHFYEFIPAAEYGTPNPVVLRSHETEIGSDYFLLLTTASGLYRYDIGDQIRVVDRIGQTPVIEFINRGAHVSSMAGEKLTERQVVLAMERACRSLPRVPEPFVLAPQWGDPPYYTLHAEASAVPAEVLSRFAEDLDRALGEMNLEYQGRRKTARLGAVVIHRVPDDFLIGRDEAAAARGRREQFKHRYLYTQPGEDRDFPTDPARSPAPATAPSLGNSPAAP